MQTVELSMFHWPKNLKDYEIFQVFRKMFCNRIKINKILKSYDKETKKNCLCFVFLSYNLFLYFF